ncbi:hypothetical protein D9M70_295310 [compost metagenome]
MVAEHLAQALLQVGAGVLFHLGDYAFVAQRLEVGDGHRRRHRVSGVGQAVGEHAALLHQYLGHALAEDQAAHGDVAGGQALGDGQGVRLEAEVLVGHPLAGAAEAADHFVGAQQHVVLAADALDFRPVAFRREDHAAGALEGFGDECGDVLGTQFEDLLLQLARGAQTELLGGQVSAVGEVVRLVDVGDVRQHAAHLVHELHAAEGRGAQGGAVVAVPAADHDLLLRLADHLPVAAHGADQHLVGLGAGVGVDRVAVVAGQQAEEQLGQFHHRRVGGVEEHVVVRQLLQLLGGRGGEVLAAVAEVGAPEAGHAIEVALAVVVPEVEALAANDHPRPFGVQRLLVEEGMDVVGRIGCLVVTGFTLGLELSVHC